MKKKVALLLSLIMIFSFAMLTACSGGSSDEDLSDSKFVGTWKVSGLSMGDESGELEQEVIMVLNGDGTGQMVADGETTEFTWGLTNDGFKTEGDLKMKFKEEDGGFYGKVVGVEMHFVKAE